MKHVRPSERMTGGVLASFQQAQVEMSNPRVVLQQRWVLDIGSRRAGKYIHPTSYFDRSD